MSNSIAEWSHVFTLMMGKEWTNTWTIDTPNLYDFQKAEIIDELFENCTLQELQNLLDIAKQRKISEIIK